MKNNLKFHIYAVDDEIYYSRLLKATLNNIGFTDVTLFESGEECLEAIVRKKPDCVVLDYIIKGGMSGEKILEKIKLLNPNIKVIILSGQNDIEVATATKLKGASNFITKDKMGLFLLGNTLNELRYIKEQDSAINKLKRKYYYLKISYIMSISITALILTIKYIIQYM